LNNPYTAPTAEMADQDGNETYTPKIFAVSGRIGRLRYIGYHWLATMLMVMIIGVLAAITIPMAGHGGSAAVGLLVLPFYGLLFAISIIYARRRLHDLDQSGWMSLLVLIPLVGFFMGLYLVFAPGTQGSNRFGPAPAKQSNAIAWVIIGGFVFIVVIGILAAVAIPAYQQYTLKARAQHQLELQQQQSQQQ